MKNNYYINIYEILIKFFKYTNIDNIIYSKKILKNFREFIYCDNKQLDIKTKYILQSIFKI